MTKVTVYTDGKTPPLWEDIPDDPSLLPPPEGPSIEERLQKLEAALPHIAGLASKAETTQLTDYADVVVVVIKDCP